MTAIRCIIVLTILTSTICQWASAVEYTNFWNGAELKANQEKVVYLKKSLNECFTMCALRPWCQVVGFNQKAMVCELYFEDIAVCEDAGEHCQLQSMTFVKRVDITGDEKHQCDSMCPSTGVLQACDLSEHTCITDVCRPFNGKENGKVLGNMYHEGSVRRLLCNRGYRPLNTNNVESRCYGGTWTNITTCISESCTDNMHTFKSSSYLIPDFTLRSFQSTQSRCVECGGHVVTMESSEEDQSVSGTMNSFQAKGIPFPEDKGVYWLGIHVKADKRVLRVHDNATVTYTNFGTNQPDSDGAEECIVVSNYFTGKWSDVRCSAQYFTVCEVES